ncbi:MAG TPA: N-acetylneuraminate synthase [Balneolales bacterium]|nr:N-acetylneuraminate synthase [Balneolales bacterium]
MTDHTKVIAEAGVNHNGDLEIAKKLIEVAAQAGADYVKFQSFKAEKLASYEARKADYQLENLPDSEITQYTMLKELELNYEFHEKLIGHCSLHDIKFLSSPFDLDSIELLHNLGLNTFKIPSGEITNLPYLQKIGSYRKNVILSTGMADIGEVEDALYALINAGTNKDNITILHCNTEYPTPFEDVNLRAMLTLRDAFKVNVGYSDHTSGIEVPIAAVSLGATIIEKHFTLDRSMAGPDHKASLEPEELKMMVRSIRNIEKCLGSGIKIASPSEEKNKSIARKSIHLAHNICMGEVIHPKDLIMLRPGDGITPMQITRILGRRVNKNLKKGHKLKFMDLS